MTRIRMVGFALRLNARRLASSAVCAAIGAVSMPGVSRGEDPEDPTSMFAGRNFEQVSVAGETATVTFGDNAVNDLQVWMVWGDSDGGTELANWNNLRYCGILRKTETTMVIPVSESADFARFFTRPAYDKTLAALVGNRGSNASVGPYFNTGDTPLYSDSIEAEITPPNLTDANYDAVFSSRKDNNSGDKTMTVFLVGQNVNDNSTKGRVRFDFGPYTGTATPSQCSKTTWSHGQRINIALANGQPMILLI